jgi:hypothetical protein
MRLAFAELMRAAATSTTIPVTNAAVEEYANTSLRALATHLFAPGLLRALQYRGENMKFAELAALNGRKQRA